MYRVRSFADQIRTNVTNETERHKLVYSASVLPYPQMEGPSRFVQKKRTANFREDETKLLIQLWGSPLIQNKLFLTHRKAPVMRILAANMQQRGFYRTSDEIKTRIRNLKCLYHRIKRTMSCGQGLGTVDPDWPHYKAMDDILSKPGIKRMEDLPLEGPKCEDIKQEIDIDVNDDMNTWMTNDSMGWVSDAYTCFLILRSLWVSFFRSYFSSSGVFHTLKSKCFQIRVWWQSIAAASSAGPKFVCDKKQGTRSDGRKQGENHINRVAQFHRSHSNWTEWQKRTGALHTAPVADIERTSTSSTSRKERWSKIARKEFERYEALDF